MRQCACVHSPIHTSPLQVPAACRTRTRVFLIQLGFAVVRPPRRRHHPVIRYVSLAAAARGRWGETETETQRTATHDTGGRSIRPTPTHGALERRSPQPHTWRLRRNSNSNSQPHGALTGRRPDVARLGLYNTHTMMPECLWSPQVTQVTQWSINGPPPRYP